MVEIKEISYKDERLGFFADQRKLVQKRYDRLEKQIKPDEPYTSERREFLSDLGRELSFYNDVVEMLENDKVEKPEIYIDDLNDSKEHLAVMLSEAESEIERLQSECNRLKKDNEYILMQHAFQRRPSGDCWNDVIEKAKQDVANEIFREIYNIYAKGYSLAEYYNDWFAKLDELKKKYLTE